MQVAAPSGLETGVVESLTLGYTVLRTYDNRRIVVPNSLMAAQVTVNLTSRDPKVMLVLPIGIGYGADLDLARTVLLELARTHPDVASVVDCPVTQLGASAVTLTLRAWCADAATAKRVQFDLLEQETSVRRRAHRDSVSVSERARDDAAHPIGRRVTACLGVVCRVRCTVR